MLKPTKLLVVDDMPNLRAIASRFLKKAGYEIIEAENGKEGLEKFLSEKPDAILTDYSMPVMKGDQMVTEIKKQNAHLPIVVLSGDAPDEILAKLIRFDNLVILSKPFNLTVFEQALEFALENRSDYHGPENRKFLRVTTDVPVDIEGYETARMEDVSIFGVFLQTDQVIPIGTPLNIKFKLDTDYQLLTVVVWKKDGDPEHGVKSGVGVKFEHLSEDERKAINRYIFKEVKENVVKE